MMNHASQAPGSRERLAVNRRLAGAMMNAISIHAMAHAMATLTSNQKGSQYQYSSAQLRDAKSLNHAQPKGNTMSITRSAVGRNSSLAQNMGRMGFISFSRTPRCTRRWPAAGQRYGGTSCWHSDLRFRRSRHFCSTTTIVKTTRPMNPVGNVRRLNHPIMPIAYNSPPTSHPRTRHGLGLLSSKTTPKHTKPTAPVNRATQTGHNVHAAMTL